MTHQRELDREHARTADPVMTEATPPGRASASAALQRPHAPIPSGIVLRKGAGDAELGAEAALASASGGAGSALPEELRTRFEGSLGVDLSSVRVHTGAASQTAARAVSARAFAVGQDIHFGAGHYDPASAAGQHLIAHEVAHTVQQRGGAAARQHKLEVSHAGDAFEVEADHAASAMVTGARAQVSSLGGGGLVQRDGERNPLTNEPELPRPLYWEGTVIDGDLVGTWSGAPQFTKVAVGDMSPEGLAWVNKVGAMKEAFTGAWNQAQSTWNAAVPAYQEYRSAAEDAEKKGLADFGGKGGDIDLDADQEDFGGKTSVGGAYLQDQDKLQPGKKTFDRDKVGSDLKRKIIDQKVAVKTAERGFDGAEREIDNGRTDLNTAGINLRTATGNLQAKKDAKDVQGLNRQIENMKRASGLINGALGTMTKAAKGEIADAVGEALQMINTAAWEGAIMQIESQVQVLESNIALDEIEGAEGAVQIARNEIRKANNNLKNKIDAYKDKCAELKKAHAALGELLEQAATQSSGSAKVGARVRAAVEAVPLMELTLTKVSALRDRCVQVPETREATLGGGMCANGQELVTHVGILASWHQQMSDAAAKWQQRLTTARALIAQAQ